MPHPSGLIALLHRCMCPAPVHLLRYPTYEIGVLSMRFAYTCAH